MAFRLAVYGYDTDIGKLVFETLDEEESFVDMIYPLSVFEGEYDAVSVKGQNYLVTPITTFDFSKADVLLLLCPKDESIRWIDKAREQGCFVIDNSNLYSGTADAVTLSPSVNPFDMKKALALKLGIPPLASTVALCHVLKVLDDEYEIIRCNVVALESFSEHGEVGTKTLVNETMQLLNGMAPDHEGFKAQCAFNLHSYIGDLDDDGLSTHEHVIKTEVETLLGVFKDGFSVTAVQVPVIYGHTLCCTVDFNDSVSVDSIREILNNEEQVTVKEPDEAFSPVENIVNERKIVVSRIRRESLSGKRYSFTVMIDNTRIGEAYVLVELLRLFRKNQ